MRRALCVFACALVLGGPAWAELRGVVAGHVPEGTVWYEQWLERKEIINSHPADITLEFFIHGELGNDDAVLSGLRRGRVSIYGPSLTGLAGLIPESAVISLPYLFETKAEADAFFRCCAKAVFEPLFEEKGFIFLGWSEAGWKGVFGKTPVRTPDQARGLKLRIPAASTSQVFVDQIGAEAIFLGLNDIVPSLQTGLIDGGMATVPFYWGMARETAPYYTVTEHAYEVAPFLASGQWWRRADDDQKALLRSVFARYGEESAAVRAFDKDLLDSMRSGDEVTVLDLTPEERQQWIDAAVPAHGRALDEIGGRSHAVYAEIQATLDRIRSGAEN